QRGGPMTAPAAAPRRPVPGATRPYHFPRFERRQLGNGIRLLVAPVTKLPLVTAIALVEAGAVCDPSGREGVAQLTAKLLLEGTERCDGATLTERFERLGASVESHADWDIGAVSMTAMAQNFSAAFGILAEVLREPAFREREVERLKAERQAELLQLRAEPRGLADELFARFLYESGSRYARPDGGDEEAVASITRDDVLRFYRSRYQPGALTLVLVGDITMERAESLAREYLDDWTGGSPGVVTTSDAPARTTRAIHVVAKPDAPQSELRVGHVGLPRNHPDYFPTVILNAVLGGLFSSRINLNLREAHGYTYGAFSSFDWRRQAGPFAVSTAVRSDVTDAAAREVLHEIERIRQEPITADELSLATSYLDGVFPIRYESTAAIAAALANLVIYAMPDDFYDRYRERVRAVRADDVLRAARTHLRADALQMVVVGDPATVRTPLEALAFGDLTVYDTLGRVAR
ncbi:MAG TPA: pitrilysin family protein, partial [Gemmatimonadaceae bacterium]|nr:pitrilysin family protein [Gemmatimonadaceae bacterium]